jgi:multidrug efflux system membrane fusion protein
MPVTVGAVGTAEAISTVEIRSQVTGQLRQIHFKPGEEVRRGQLLFTLDPRPFDAAVRQAEAVLARDTAQANDAKAQRERAKNLLDRGIIPREQFDTLAAGAEALEATLAADQAQLDQARLNLQYARITAPIDGKSGALMVHEGDLVRANDAIPLVTINQLSPIYVTFSVPARLLGDFRRDASHAPLTVTATGKGDAGPKARGKVTFIDNAVDTSTATIRLKATFPNTDRDLWPGLFVEVSVLLSTEPNAIVVPAIAVQTSQQGQYVFVVTPEGTAEMRAVTVERQQGDEAIITRGLDGNEQVVTDGHLRLTPGAPVTVVRTGRSQS